MAADETATRRGHMALLAQADASALAACWANWTTPPAYNVLRGPETGLVMLRGRAGGGGAAFNFGEATVTRAAVRLDSGEIGHAYALGRDEGRAIAAAVIDALWQRPDDRAALRQLVFEPLAAAEARRQARLRAESAATRVNFFTLVRGEDA